MPSFLRCLVTPNRLLVYTNYSPWGSLGEAEDVLEAHLSYQYRCSVLPLQEPPVMFTNKWKLFFSFLINTGQLNRTLLCTFSTTDSQILQMQCILLALPHLCLVCTKNLCAQRTPVLAVLHKLRLGLHQAYINGYGEAQALCLCSVLTIHDEDHCY